MFSHLKSTPSDLSHDDVLQWFLDGYFLYRTDAGTLVPAFMTERFDQVDENYEWVVRLLGRGSQLHNYVPDSRGEGPFQRERLYPYWPKCGALNIEKEGYKFAVFLTRQSRQEYRRTYSINTLRCQLVDSYGIRSSVPTSITQNIAPYDYTVALAAFYPKYKTMRQALRQLENDANTYSVAVTPQVVISRRSDTSDGSLRVYVNNEPAAHWDPEERLLTPAYEDADSILDYKYTRLGKLFNDV